MKKFIPIVNPAYFYYLKPVSRWIRLEYKYVTKRHSLAIYADFSDDSDDGKGLLTCFRHNNRLYALAQFMKLSSPVYFENEDGKLDFCCGYDCTDYSNHPLLINISDGGEYIRLFEEYAESEVCE